MHNFLLLTDDCCDLPPNYYREHDVFVEYLHFSIDGESYTSRDMGPEEFFAQMRAGKMPITSQVTVGQWLEVFENLLLQGKDILYLAFSSGLSSSCGSSQVAAKQVMEKHPERKIVVVDSLCASLGQGLLLHKLIGMRDSGASLEETARWAEENKLHVSHMVAVDDLMHLHRGGRVSKTSAVAGSLLGIKPIIHMNNEGKLIPIDKVRGRRQSLQNIVDKTIQLVGDVPNDFFTVCHSDCLDEANYVAELASKHFGIKDYLVHFIGPVIGTHTGTGTISLFMMANHR